MDSEKDPERTTDTYETYDDDFSYKRRISPEGEFVDEKELTAVATDGSTYAGKWVREQMHRSDYAFGYCKGQFGIETPTISPEMFNRHIYITGGAGTGKTTLVKNTLRQVADKGHGFLFVDTSAGETSTEIVQTLPEHRLEDVLIVGEGINNYTGIDLFGTMGTPDDGGFDREVGDVVQLMTEIIRPEDTNHWSRMMDRYVKNIVKCMVRLEADPDVCESFEAVDLYEVTTDPERREEFINTANSTDETSRIVNIDEIINNLDDSDLKTIQKQIGRVVNMPYIGGEESINLPKTISDGNLIFISHSLFTDEREIGTQQVIKSAWNAITSRKLYSTTPDIFVGAVDDLDSFNEEIENTISNWTSMGRELNSPLIVTARRSDELSESMIQTIANNCGTVIAFNPKGTNASNTLARVFQPYKTNDLLELVGHETLVITNHIDNSDSDGTVKVDAFAPYPPVRTVESARRVLSAK